jgi:hypothetical protein
MQYANNNADKKRFALFASLFGVNINNKITVVNTVMGIPAFP